MMADDKSDMEKAEGSRENVNLPEQDVNWGSATGSDDDSRMERGSGQVSRPEKPIEGGRQEQAGHGGSAQKGAGITNRPLDEEKQNQDELPPRGESRGETR
jgi:hypothetical protein